MTDLCPIVCRWTACAQQRTVNSRFARQNTLRKFGFTHFQREKEYGLHQSLSSVHRESKCKCTLTHCWTSSDDVECAGLQAEQHFVEFCNSCWHTRDGAFVVNECLKFFDRLIDQHVDFLCIVSDMTLANIENLALCIINCFINVVWFVECDLGNIGCCTN